ncbi:MAG: transcriptional repressor [Arcobacteraceae bacterium]|nr:transcriptional repressor [Arcobacteraceae bacterium]
MDIEKIIEDTNLKLTPARLELLELLIGANKPLCYDDIKDNIQMDKATFYRNIAKFETENLINSFESNDKKRYYAIEQTPHPHFICSSCNTIECIQSKINLNLDGYIIDNIIIKGICKNCKKR